jgi:hypothetical protein
MRKEFTKAYSVSGDRTNGENTTKIILFSFSFGWSFCSLFVDLHLGLYKEYQGPQR